MRKILAACLFLLAASTPSFAASKLYISEYTNVGTSNGVVAQIASEPAKDQSPLDYSGGVQVSAAFAARTNYVRLLCTSTCSVVFGTSPTATTSNKIMAAGVAEYFAVPPNQSLKVSVISNTDF